MSREQSKRHTVIRYEAHALALRLRLKGLLTNRSSWRPVMTRNGLMLVDRESGVCETRAVLVEALCMALAVVLTLQGQTLFIAGTA